MNRGVRTRQRQLEEARATVQALVSGQVDTVAGPSSSVLLAAANALRAAEERYRVLLDAAPDAMVVFNDRGEIQMLNRRTKELFGYAAEDLVGRSIELLFSARVLAERAQHRAAYFQNPRPMQLGVEERIHCRRADGSEFPAEICLNPAQTNDGVHIIAAIRDIRARVEIEDALRESEARLASTLNSIGEGVLATDLHGIVTRINPVAEQVTGFTRDEAIGRHLDEIYHVLSEKTRQPIWTPVRGLANGGATVAPTARLVTRDRRERAISQSAAPIRKPTGEVVGVVLAFRDVTAQREMQEQLHISERMVSLGTLAAGIAHEINNPLAALIGNLDVLMEDMQRPPSQQFPLSGFVDEVLRDVREAAEQVRLIVKDLKVFSRSDEDGRGPVDVQRLLESALRLAWNEVRHRARLVKEWQVVPPVIANEARLGEVFVNLIVNAAQAIPEGHADRNEIRLVTSLDGQGRVAIEVRDTGVGIPPEVRARIFDPFFTTKPVGVGTGLGLAICHRIVTELGGDITVASVPGEGTTFRVTLPIAPADRVAPGAAHVEREAARRRGAVMVIDDDLLVRSFVRRALSNEHDVSVESCGEDAFARIQSGERFDLILCDVMMPEMTGLELYDLISAASPEQAKRIVFITGGAFTGGIQRVLEATGNPRLDKPFHADRLRELVDGILEARRSVEAEVAAPPFEAPHTAPAAAPSSPTTRVSTRRGSLSPAAQGKRRTPLLRH
jgi:PAS domain S-box-containing protein